MLGLKPGNNTNCIDAHPEVEALLVTEDSRAEVMGNVLDWLTEGG